MGLISDLTGIANAILGVRDSIGAAIHPVYIVTRTWSGTEPGDGTSTDVAAQVTPTPAIVDLEADQSVVQAGNYKQGDLRLRHISKESYPLEDTVSLKSSLLTVETFYKINNVLYSVVKVREDYISWHVHIRRVSHT